MRIDYLADHPEAAPLLCVRLPTDAPDTEPTLIPFVRAQLI